MSRMWCGIIKGMGFWDPRPHVPGLVSFYQSTLQNPLNFQVCQTQLYPQHSCPHPPGCL